MALHAPRRRPEVLAPAGDSAAMRAAVRAGADAVYFGLQSFNARARAHNFAAEELSATVDDLHEHGVRAYVALNTLAFDTELSAVEQAVRTCAAAGVDAVIVQDLGVAKLVRAVAPAMAIHASTQMTCTDAGAVEFARSLGATRVILARELSLDDIAAIRSETDVELEVFVHGALCIAYSGQCLTSEAIGGRSANRGACAQACRLPYELVVDGVVRDLGDRAYLLSPEDLEASALVPRLVELGVASLKIEGRLKGPEYVAATTQLYRSAISAAMDADVQLDPSLRPTALQMYSRGSGPGFLGGVDHQRLVEGSGCDHRGLPVGVVTGTCVVRGKKHVRIRLEGELARGDGLRIDGGFAGSGEAGGRVWALLHGADAIDRAAPGAEVLVWLGPDAACESVTDGRRVWKTNDPGRERDVLASIERAPERVALDIAVTGRLGERPVFVATTGRGLSARVEGDVALDVARSSTQSIADVVREKLARLGESPFELRELSVDVPREAMIPPASLNRARRALVDALVRASHTRIPVTDQTAASLIAESAPSGSPPPAGLFVLCRTLAQANAALDAGADGLYLDFLELTGTGAAVRALRERGPVHITLAPPRIRKPGEQKIDQYLASLKPDALLVRGLGALGDSAQREIPRIADFSLNVTNRLSAAEILSHGVIAFTPSFDLDASQLVALLETPFGPYAEVVVHHPMPLFHMEHCVIAALLSQGSDHRTCGRPCETHRVSLRDRAGMEHPVEADVGCRNTVFHAAAQSAAGIVAAAQRSGVRRYRVELVREGADDVGRVVDAYKRLLRGDVAPGEVFRSLRADGSYGVVRGSLRVLAEHTA